MNSFFMDEEADPELANPQLYEKWNEFFQNHNYLPENTNVSYPACSSNLDNSNDCVRSKIGKLEFHNLEGNDDICPHYFQYPLFGDLTMDQITPDFEDLPNHLEKFKTCQYCMQFDRLAKYPNGTLGEDSDIRHLFRDQLGEVKSYHNVFLFDYDDDLRDWIIKTQDKFHLERPGGISVNAKNQIAVEPKILANYTDINEHRIRRYSKRLVNEYANKAWFNNFYMHSPPIYLSSLHNGLINKVHQNLSITTYNKPYTFTNEKAAMSGQSPIVMQALLAITVITALSVVPSSFVVFLVDEKKNGIKHLESLAGVPPWVYWLSNLIWDTVIYILITICVIFIFFLFDHESFLVHNAEGAGIYTGAESIGTLVTLLLVFGWAIIPAMYPFSFMFEEGSTAYVILTVANFFIGLVTSMMTSMLEMLVLQSDDYGVLTIIYEWISFIFLIFPHYCVGKGIIDMGIHAVKNQETSVWYTVEKKIQVMSVEGIIFAVIILLIEYGNIFYSRKIQVAKDEKMFSKWEQRNPDMYDETNVDQQVKKMADYATRIVDNQKANSHALTPLDETKSLLGGKSTLSNQHLENVTINHSRHGSREIHFNHRRTPSFGRAEISQPNVESIPLIKTPSDTDSQVKLRADSDQKKPRPDSLAIKTPNGLLSPSMNNTGFTSYGPGMSNFMKSNMNQMIPLAVSRLTKMYTHSSFFWGIYKKTCSLFGVDVSRENTDVLAVNNVGFAVQEGQCFGLLGTNGAGKSTTFKMLTGDIASSKGTASICGHKIQEDIRAAQKEIGYCPQSNAIFDTMTTTEHLHIFAALRGIHRDDIEKAVKWAIDKLDLKKLKDEESHSYSGGNKRKLSTAIAIIGAPKVVFLDEPTAGMDPATRRFLWDCVKELILEKHTVILTSHSMEECDNLCSVIAIMVNGTFRCIGAPQTLKSTFGKGYILLINMNDDTSKDEYGMIGSIYQHRENPMDSQFDGLLQTQPSQARPKKIKWEDDDFVQIHTFIKQNIADAKLKEQHANVLQYRISDSTLKLANIFELMEIAKKKFNIKDYSLSQATLDDVFVMFAREQMKEKMAGNRNNHNKDSDRSPGASPNSPMIDTDIDGSIDIEKCQTDDNNSIITSNRVDLVAGSKLHSNTDSNKSKTNNNSGNFHGNHHKNSFSEASSGDLREEELEIQIKPRYPHLTTMPDDVTSGDKKISRNSSLREGRN